MTEEEEEDDDEEKKKKKKKREGNDEILKQATYAVADNSLHVISFGLEAKNREGEPCRNCD
jgi:hypothetical protein